ncbi:hypothetical protein MLD38_006695 [Melastoma candidum]|uniref:Uncharacterized protein n=1 Tax=Melastoma candidum TaxID=119954 RepID=A0ACB9RQL2_9MYRT|nr:hypothetical protein MLD38_006695 [Melastoma candidum]
MKKAKGKGIDAVPDSFPVPEDPRIRFRHQGLLQDYRDLLKETDATRKKIEILKQRKLTLLTEVQFLRRRYQNFVDNRISKPLQSRHTVNPKKTTKRKDPGTKAPVSGSIATKKQKPSNMRRQAVPPANSKEKKISKKDDVSLYSSSMSVDLDQIDILDSRREVASMKSHPAYELPQKQMLFWEADANLRNPVPVFDLNQISAEELQTSSDQPRIEAAYKVLSGGNGINDHRNEINLGVPRNRTNMKGHNKVEKRRISWQDQVALRV